MKPNWITTVVITLLVAGGVYLFFFTKQDEVPLSITGVENENPAQAQFKRLVTQLDSIKFRTGIFTDPNFTVLVDIATPVTPEASGRPDPFATIPGVVGK